MTSSSGSSERFDQLYRTLSGSILAYAARRTTSAHDAAYVMAETFAIAWRKIDDVPEGDNARPWLYGVARGVLANHHRSNRRRHRLSERVTSQLAAAVELSVTQIDTSVDPAVNVALSSLDEPDRELLMLLAWDDLSRDEAAQVLGCNTATLRVRLHRARWRFRAALEADEHSVDDSSESSDAHPRPSGSQPFSPTAPTEPAPTATEEVS